MAFKDWFESMIWKLDLKDGFESLDFLKFDLKMDFLKIWFDWFWTLELKVRFLEIRFGNGCLKN